MREIKFRMYALDIQKMFPMDRLHLPCTTKPNPASVYMQFTGLKDSGKCENYPEGMDIYESDILWDQTEDEYYIVTWDEDYANFYLKNVQVDDLDRQDYDFLEFDNDISNSLYVVGNIYENPEFLAE